MRMDRLDEIVIGQIIEHVLDPERLRTLLDAYLQSASEGADGTSIRSTGYARSIVIRRPPLIEKGFMETEDPSLKERLLGLKLQRDERVVEIADLQQRLSSNEPEITPEKIGRFATLLRDKLLNGTPEFRQVYARMVMREVSVRDKEIRIIRSKAILAEAASQGFGKALLAVLSFVREWRTRQDSNL